MKQKIKITVREHTEIKMRPKEFVKFIAPKVGMEYPFENVKGCRKRGYLTFDEFLTLAYSKTPRQKRKYTSKKNEQKVEDVTREAFKQKDLDSIIKKLTELDGVGVPVASYLLTAWNPKDYGTLDFRMKDILEKCDEDFKKPKKESSDLEWYKAELDLLRKWRDELDIETCRQVEYALWIFQQMTSDSGEKPVEMEV